MLSQSWATKPSVSYLGLSVNGIEGKLAKTPAPLWVNGTFEVETDGTLHRILHCQVKLLDSTLQ